MNLWSVEQNVEHFLTIFVITFGWVWCCFAVAPTQKSWQKWSRNVQLMRGLFGINLPSSMKNMSSYLFFYCDYLYNFIHVTNIGYPEYWQVEMSFKKNNIWLNYVENFINLFKSMFTLFTYVFTKVFSFYFKDLIINIYLFFVSGLSGVTSLGNQSVG